MNTLYDPSFEERGLPLDPHLRCFALELAKKNAGEFFYFILFYCIIYFIITRVSFFVFVL